jgi:hypothetical protein
LFTDLEETETRNNCAGEGQQQFNRSIDRIKAADDTPLVKIRPYDIQKLIKSLKLRKACGIDDFKDP